MAEENDPKAPCAVKPFRPRPSQMEKRVRELAKISGNVFWRAKTYTTHTESQMEWRDITDTMMFDVLRTGYVKGDVEPGRNPGEWKVKMCKQMKGKREVGVVTLIIHDRKLFIKTVEWEDLK